MGTPRIPAHVGGMTFEKLRVYQAAELLNDMVNELVALIPRGYAREIDNLKRAAASIPHNIAEAYGTSRGRRALHLEIARGSADESRSILRGLARRGALRPHNIDRPCSVARAIGKMLTSWIDGIEK
jgi:four helix bundle protein